MMSMDGGGVVTGERFTLDDGAVGEERTERRAGTHHGTGVSIGIER